MRYQWVTLVLIGFAALAIAACERRDQITVYPAMCIDRGRAFSQCPFMLRILLNQYTYTLNRAQSEASYRYDNFPEWGVKKLVNCAIFDLENWTCDYPDGSGSVSIVNGVEQASPEDDRSGHGYVGKWHAWLLWTISVLRAFSILD